MSDRCQIGVRWVWKGVRCLYSSKAAWLFPVGSRVANGKSAASTCSQDGNKSATSLIFVMGITYISLPIDDVAGGVALYGYTYISGLACGNSTRRRQWDLFNNSVHPSLVVHLLLLVKETLHHILQGVKKGFKMG
jgi:hypothetical protein